MWLDEESERIRKEDNEKFIKAYEEKQAEEKARVDAQNKKMAEEEGMQHYPHTREYWRIMKRHSQPIPEHLKKLWPELV